MGFTLRSECGMFIFATTVHLGLVTPRLTLSHSRFLFENTLQLQGCLHLITILLYSIMNLSSRAREDY